MPSLSHHTESGEGPPAPVDPNGAPLSERIAWGRPMSLKTRSIALLTPAPVGSTMRTSMRKRLAESLRVSGSQRIPSPLRNQPLKSIAHSSLGVLAAATTSPCAIARRRLRLPPPPPLRNRPAPSPAPPDQAFPLEDVADRRGRRPVDLRPLVPEPCFDLLRAEMRKPAPRRNDAVGQPGLRRMRAALGRVASLLEPVRLPALSTALPDVKRLPADAMPCAQIRHRKRSSLVLPKQRNTLLHRTALPERHRPILLRIRRSLPVRNQPGLNCQDSARFIPRLSPTPTLPREERERERSVASVDMIHNWGNTGLGQASDR